MVPRIRPRIVPQIITLNYHAWSCHGDSSTLLVGPLKTYSIFYRQFEGRSHSLRMWEISRPTTSHPTFCYYLRYSFHFLILLWLRTFWEIYLMSILYHQWLTAFNLGQQHYLCHLNELKSEIVKKRYILFLYHCQHQHCEVKMIKISSSIQCTKIVL